MFKTIVSKFAGRCRRCGIEFAAGSRIRYGGYGRTYHLNAECPQVTAERDADAQFHAGIKAEALPEIKA